MNASRMVVVVVMMIMLSAGGCVHNKCRLAEVRRENAELKSRVAALESQLAELRKEQKLAVSVNGITLPPSVLNETPWTLRGMKSIAAAKPASATGEGRSFQLAGGSIVMDKRGAVIGSSPATTRTTVPAK